MSTPFDFLKAEFPQIHEGAMKAGALAKLDPRTSCFHTRWTIEQAIKWAFKHDRSLYAPYDDKLSALLNEPGFRDQLGDPIYRMAREAIRLGNRAAHEPRPISSHDSIAAASHLFEFTYWFARTFAKTKPPAGLRFDPRALPDPTAAAKASPAQQESQKAQVDKVQELQRELEEAALVRQRLEDGLADRAELEAELEALRAQVAKAKAAASAVPDDHDYSEAATRDYFIDLLLAEAGWDITDREREVEVEGMPGGRRGRIDYVLWGDDGRPLAIIEAKRTRRDAREGQQQAKLYADALEASFGRRPIIFCTNGYEHWLWDDVAYPARAVQGFLTQDELELTIQRRTTRRPLAEVEIDPTIVERHYQTRAIRRIGEAFEVDRSRKALVVMATGAGKTRTVVALSDLLMRAGWAKRILFLADRRALVAQAANVFKNFLPDSAPVNLLTDPEGEGRIYASTHQSMLNRINELRDGRRRFGVGHFDLVVIDEAHRSVFQKYRAIFEHFDSLLVGLTATPKDEVDRNTYGLFDLETGVPTDAYGIDEAVADGYLVPPKAISVPLRFQREGIRYDDLSEEEKDEWDALDWGDDDPPPDQVGSAALNRWLFNGDTVDKVLAHLMTHGQKVAGGDRLGKTIIFAKSQDHADFIGERFDRAYPHLRGHFARVITNRTEYADSLIETFEEPEADPHIAISVDMLDTGIDVPEVVNLVFFKLVRSKTKFWQMLGRGTRLRPDLFGPGQNKEFFTVFDFCQNLEFFSQNPDITDGALAPSLAARTFITRLDLLAAIDATGDHRDERREIADLLRVQVEGMNIDNVIVRPHRQLVETYREPEAWDRLDAGEASALALEIAGLPSAVPFENEATKRFDLLLLRLQLALLRVEPSFTTLRSQVQGIAHLLEDYSSIPAIAGELALIHDVQTDRWWTDITFPMVEQLRRRLRLLVPFIEQKRRAPLYTDFEDVIGDGREVSLAGLAVDDFERFRRKTRQYLREHEDLVAVEKVRRNRPITATDLDELQRVLIDAGVGTDGDIARATEEAGGFGVFVRGLVGLDRAAAKDAFAGFLANRRLSADQIEFVNLVIDHLTDHGVIEPRSFYESPFTDLSPTGPDAVFALDDVEELIAVVRSVKANASAA